MSHQLIILENPPNNPIEEIKLKSQDKVKSSNSSLYG